MRFSQSEVVLHSNDSNYRKNLENKINNALKYVCWMQTLIIYAEVQNDKQTKIISDSISRSVNLIFVSRLLIVTG